MFPSQPQIGRDMARERRAVAEGFRRAEIGRSERGPTEDRTGGLSRVAGLPLRVLTALGRRLGVPGLS